MGNSPLTVCIHHAWEKQTIQVVLPDGQVLFMPQPLTVANLLEAHPSHFVCQGSPSLLEQRLPADAKLDSGEIYYLLPVPRPVFPAMNSFQRRSMRPKSRKLAEKVVYRPPPYTFDKTPPSKVTDYTQLNWKPHGCLVNFFVFRHGVASIMPEESFKIHAGGDPCAPRPPARRHHKLESRTYRSARGRKQVLTWKPHLESISETKTLQDFAKKSVTGFSVSLFSSAKTSPVSSPPGSPLNSGVQHGERTVVMHAPLHVEREIQKQKLMYSA